MELRELKPRARIPTVESDAQNSFLIIFTEDFIEKKHKKYIRYFDANKTTKNNLLRHKSFPDVENFNRNLKFFETRDFFSLLKSLLPIDYALLIQKSHNTLARYALTHFHVRIDWPITEAAEDLARDLRYISKDLYEKGDENISDKNAEETDLKVIWAKKMQYNDTHKKASFYEQVEVTRGGQKLNGDQVDAYLDDNKKINKIIAINITK